MCLCMGCVLVFCHEELHERFVNPPCHHGALSPCSGRVGRREAPEHGYEARVERWLLERDAITFHFCACSSRIFLTAFQCSCGIAMNPPTSISTISPDFSS